jgi:hypothetical protein
MNGSMFQFHFRVRVLVPVRVPVPVLLVLVLVPVLATPVPAFGQVNMPDPSQIAGRALPARELPDGTVSVRLVRESIGNNIGGHDVSVTAGGSTRRGRTDESGRAQVTGLPAGASATAEAVVDGETLTSQPFEVPATGGIRVILIAGLDQARARRQKEEDEAAKAPPVKGTVVFGGDSRIVFEFQNDTLRAFYILEVVNTARTRVDTGGPLIIDLPRGAGGARVMEGSYPGASVNGDRVTVLGPFPAGSSAVQVGFQVPYSGSELAITQKFPVTLQKVEVAAEKIGAVHVSSPQFASHGDVKAGDGTPFILANGGTLQPGSELTIQFTGLPHEATWPRNVALALAAAILGVGAWLASRKGERSDERRHLIARRDSLYAELVKVEEQHRAGRMDTAPYEAKRQALLPELERIYGELDEPTAPARSDGVPRLV